MWLNQLQIAAAVLRVRRPQCPSTALLYPARRPTTPRAPSPDWGEDDGELTRLGSTSGASRHLPLHPRQCLLPQLPCHPLWLQPNQPAVREGGPAQPPCQSEGFRARARQAARKARRPLKRNVGDAVIKSIRLGSTSPRKTSWKMARTSQSLTPWDRTVEFQQVRSFSPEISQVFN